MLGLDHVVPGVTRRGPGAREDRGLVEAVEDRRLAVPVFRRQRDPGQVGERRHEVQAADDLRVAPSRLDRAGPPGDGRDAVAALPDSAFGSAEGCIARVWINVLPRAIVCRPDDQRVLIQAELTNLVEDLPDPSVGFNDRIRILGFRGGLFNEIGMRQICW